MEHTLTMTNDNARKKQIRAYADEHGLSYTAALRALEQQRATAADAQLAFLSRLFPTVKDAAPRVPATFALEFEPHEDLTQPYPLYLNAVGQIAQQDLWRGERFNVLGFARDMDSRGIDVRWGQAVDDPASVVGLHPVISEFSFTLATWSMRVAELAPTPLDPDRSMTPVHATFTSSAPDSSTEPFRFRVEGLLGALSDDELDRLIVRGGEIGDDAGQGEDRTLADLLFRAAVRRGDPEAVRANEWVEHQHETHPDRWDEVEPFLVDLDETELAAWYASTHLVHRR